MMVVPVLITSCHVSLKPNSGPVNSQTTISPTAAANTKERPVARAVRFAKSAYQLFAAMKHPVIEQMFVIMHF
jgi:hypothetical protein